MQQTVELGALPSTRLKYEMQRRRTRSSTWKERGLRLELRLATNVEFGALFYTSLKVRNATKEN